MQLKLDTENKEIHNVTHNLGILRGLNYAYSLVMDQLATNGEATTEAEKEYQSGVIEAGKQIQKTLIDLNNQLGFTRLNTLEE